jgi:uncharacterized protein YndB with AHSA1/START domain
VTRIAASVDIAATPDTVWAAIEDPASHVEWMADAERIEFTTERRHGVGTEFVCETRIGPFTTSDVMTIVEWDPARAMGVRHRGAVSGVGRFTLEPIDGGHTRFAWRENLHFPARMGGPVGAALARPVLAWVWRSNLRRLKARVERRE